MGLIKGDRVLNAMKEFIPDINIEDLKINFSATAADITNNKEVVFKSGSLFDAIRASISIPTVLTPVIKDNAIMVDGGVLNNIPIGKTTIPKKATKKHSVYLEKISEFYAQLQLIQPKDKTEKMGYFSLLDKTLTAGTQKLAQLIIEKGAPDVLINISRHSCGTYDFYLAKEQIEIGRQAAASKLNPYTLVSFILSFIIMK